MPPASFGSDGESNTRSESRSGFVECLVDTAREGLRCRLAIGEIALRRIDGRRQGISLEEPEQWPKLVFDDQRMAVAAACRGQEHGFAAQCRRIEQIEEMFEQPGIAALVGW